jgi:CO/xanthine dehydrogenase Mo-binding subunit
LGIACCLKNVGLGHGSERDKAAASVEVGSSGRVLVRTGAAEVGQGLLTMLSQITAHQLGAKYQDIEVQFGDTRETPDGGVTSASRQTFTTGSACLLAAQEVQSALVSRAAELLNCAPETLECRASTVVDRDNPSRRMTFAALAETFPDGRLHHEALYRPPDTHALGTHGPDGLYRTHHSYGYGAQVAMVDVDEQTGRVQVRKLIVAADVGRALFLPGVVGQALGAGVMGTGYALREELKVADGILKTRNLGGCRLLRFTEVPDLEVIVVEDPTPFGPYGAKGTGELSVVPTAPAIVNAIHDAAGVWITDLPATPERVRAALAARQGDRTNGS